MKTKLFISFFFLSVYTLTFAHSFIPHINNTIHSSEHCNAPQTKEDAHQHTTHSTNFSCISHDNHCDESVFDLLICLFSDFHHHSNDCDIHYLDKENTKTTSSSLTLQHYFSDLQDAAYLTDHLFTVELQKLEYYLFNKRPTPLINQTLLRGPPVY